MKTIDFICVRCKQNFLLDMGCRAFTDGIPDEILGTNKHDKSIKYQDNDLVFEPIHEVERE